MIYIFLAVILAVVFFNGKGVPVFLYHQVNSLSNITPELFEEHLKIIKQKNMNTVTLSEYGEGNIPKNSMLITFDDGYYDNYKIVFPLLKKYNMKATIFLNTLYIGEKRWGDTVIEKNGTANYKAMKKYTALGDGTTEQYMTWKEIKEMYDSGLVDFQAHSHKHMAVFKEIKLQGVFNEDSKDCTDVFLYREVEEGFPKFRKRGEYSTEGIIINKEFFKKFQEYYFKNLKGKSEKEIISKGQKFIDENIEPYMINENAEDFKKRITEEFTLNKTLIEKNLGNNVKYFCWPWGHRSKEAVEILKSLGVKGFITTKKGTNSYSPDWEMIRRIELRKFTPEKFKINLMAARNLLIGKLYGLVS